MAANVRPEEDMGTVAAAAYGGDNRPLAADELLALRRLQLVLGPGFEIAGVVPLVELPGRIAPGPVDHAPALHRRPRRDFLRPAIDVPVGVRLQEFRRAVH